MKKYYDCELEKVFTEQELKEIYNLYKEEIYESSGAENFGQYLSNCLSKNGFLEEV